MATVGRIAHEKFVDAEIGNLLERLQPLEESLELRLRRREPHPRARVATGRSSGASRQSSEPR
jgi:hypothetical protein